MEMIVTLDIDISFNDMRSGAEKILHVIKPEWNMGDCSFKLFTEGITNKLMACQHKEDTERANVVLIRVYGEKTDLIIDRNKEIENMQQMHLNGLAKAVYAKFNNGIAYGFVPGVCLDEKTVREPTIARLIILEMVKMHSIRSQGDTDTSPCLFSKTKNFIDLSPDEYPDPEMNVRYKENIPSKDKLYIELEFMKSHLEVLESPSVFCHNDLLLQNIVYSQKEDRAYFIDFEYGAYNYEAYEIGNHFCEYAGIDNPDYNLYPEKSYQLVWLRQFLQEKRRLQNKSGTDVTDDDVEKLYVQVNQFALMAHFFWGVWGLIQARYSSIDFDYLDYAGVRLNEYFAKKEKFLALKMP